MIVKRAVRTNVLLLQRAIAQSGLSAAGFATEVLMRDARTIQRWLDAETRIPPAVVTYLKRRVK